MPPTGDGARIVVVGSGPAGATAVRALASRGYPVTLLESGLRPVPAFRVSIGATDVVRRAPGATSPLPFEAEGTPAPIWHHELAVGGLSNHWTGFVPRFHPFDFRDGARISEEYEWPITYEDLAPYYGWCEKLLSVTGSTTTVPGLPAGNRHRVVSLPRSWTKFATAAEARGQGVVPIPTASGQSGTVSRDAKPFTSQQILRRLPESDEVEIRTGAHALRLTVSSSGLVNGVEYFDQRASGTRWVACAGVILAAGAVATPQLLLNSAAHSFPNGIGNENGLVGRYLSDHTHDWVVVRLRKPSARLRHPLYFTRIPHAESEPLSGVGYTFSGRVDRKSRLSVHLPGNTTNFAFNAFGMEKPTPDHRVSLSTSVRDCFGLPAVKIHSPFSDDAYQSLERSRGRLIETLDAAGYGPTLVWHMDGCTPGDSVHWSGSVRMHESPRFGACDGRGRIHTSPNVAIADASLLTTPVEKNPTLTVMALAARSALLLARDLERGATCAPK